MKFISKFKLIALVLFWATGSFAELQTTLSMSTPALTPGQSGPFTATSVTGPAASTTSTLINPYAGVMEYVLSPGTGRFDSLSGTRYGIMFDSFQLFQSFLTPNFFTVLSSNTTCPAGPIDYTWLLVRYRAPDSPRYPMNASSAASRVGGWLTYDSGATPVFQSTTAFNLAGPTVFNTSYSFDNSAFGACSNGVVKASTTVSPPLDKYGRFFFGTNFGMYVSAGGNPIVATLVPKQTLNGTTFTNLSRNVYSGLFTGFDSHATQTQQNIYLSSDGSGNFTLTTVDDFNDPTVSTAYGAISCTSWNSPSTGFCSGTLTLAGMGGSSNAICQIGSTSSQDLISCTFAMPNNSAAGGSLVVTRHATSLLSVTVPAGAAAAAISGSQNITATVQNLTGTYVGTMGNPAPALMLVNPPWSNPGAWAGTSGTCTSTLNGFSSCNVTLTFAPTTVGTANQVFRVNYNNQSASVNATTTVTGVAGLTSLAISPNSSSFSQGTTQQFTVTATYSNGATQDVTSWVTWNSSNGAVATVSSSGLASFLSNGTTTFTASLAGVDGTLTPTIYNAPPNPSGFSATPASYTQINLGWTSGGGSTASFQVAYQSGATAPANCNSGTVITSGVIGASVSYNVTGLTPGTQYSFRVCADAGVGSLSSGVTASATTNTPQRMFSTAAIYNGNLGGLYFADYICQSEALTAGLSGTWKAVLGDASTSAASRISLSQSVYNFRPTGSGGQQLVVSAAGFWGGTFTTAANYTASGGTPGSTVNWTGATTTGAVYASRNCSSWTTSSSGTNGQYGTNTATNSNAVSQNQVACNNSYGLYCINMQSASATPSNPTGFTNSVTSSTSIQFSWASGGGTTAAYRLAYQTGGTAPASCAAGTIISDSTLGINPTNYTVTGLTANTQYSFRLCAYNSDLSAASSGTTLTVTTTSSGSITNLGSRQIVFSTSATYNGSFGGIYFADYICQTDASNNGLNGTWKAIMGDESTSVSSRLSIPGAVFNNRPSGSGGYQQVAGDSTTFYASSFAYQMYYNAAGGTPGSTLNWTGTTAAGAVNAGRTCTNWTTASSGTNGQYGQSNTTGNLIAGNQSACNNSYSIYCTNQQSSSAAPSNPTGFAASITTTTSIQFGWASGGGTTAAYQLAYQAGGTAPADCTSGTVVSASTLGLNPTSYTVTGLTANTQYSFRLCAYNSDLTSASSGATATVTTTSSGSVVNLGSRQIVFSTANTYTGSFGGVYFGDYICQTEAETAGLNGVWKAILSDEATSAASRLTLGAVYNNRPSGSGGYQLLAADSASFWSNSFPYTAYYTTTGSTPSTNIVWTGSTTAGAINAGNTCDSWTTASSGNNGTYGVSSNTGNLINTNPTACNTSRALYCTNQQSSSAAPPDPTGFLASTYNTSSIQFTWASGGGTTAAYKLVYQTGGTAPANCSSGTVVSAATLGVNPSTYTLSGLSSSTQYSFRLCAVNSDQTASSTGVTLSVTTTAFGTVVNLGTRQIVFATNGTYTGGFGGIYFGDFICNQEATNAGLSGVWKAILSNGSSNASTRIAIPGIVYNNRPNISGGYQQVAADQSSFWSSTMAFPLNFDANGGTPSGTTSWTGSSAAGAVSANTCTNWTTSSSGVNGTNGNNNGTGNVIANNTSACNSYRTLYCTNQQSADAAPADPTGFTYSSYNSTSIQFVWASGGTTTAAYQLAYQTGGTAPADCASGTVIPASTLGVNPTGYAITGLSASTQYSFRLCAYNADLSAASSGVTTTITTTSGGTITNLGSRQVIFTTNATYTGNFGGLHFGDYACQMEANSAGLSGIWKAILSDGSTTALSRISIPGSVYNFRPTASGGNQLEAIDSSSFYSSAFPYNAYYNALGNTPGSNIVWTGTTAAGATGASHCTNWTSSNNGINGVYGNTNTTGNIVGVGQTACNTYRALLCTNQQSAAAAPADPTNFATYVVGPTSVGMTWASGGGTTAAYRIAYQTGGTAPANCSTGTVISDSTLGVNPRTYVVTGLTASTQYSFRICAYNADLSSASSGVTLTTTTLATAATPVVSFGSTTQVVFQTNSNYTGGVGGLYFADYICQNDATNAGLTGVWKAILSDEATAASSRITMAGNVFNNRPVSSGGIQWIASNSASFFETNFQNSLRYNASGGTPTNVNAWTGSTSTGGINAGLTCSSWTDSTAGSNGRYGVTTTTLGVGSLNAGTAACNNANIGFYCTNQQSAAAAPSDPSGFTVGTVTTSTIPLTWTSGGGTTAAFKIAYQTGATAPADCNTGTIIAASTLGVNPAAYTVTGLASGQQYAFRLCALNSDQSAASSGVTVTGTTTALSAPANQTIFATAATYRPIFGGPYFADFICQTEATAAALSGVWKAVLSDSSVNANARIALSATTWNARPAGSGGPQQVATSATFWVGPWTASPVYNAAGGAVGNTATWTASTGAGALTGAACTDWTSNSASVQGRYGNNNQTAVNNLFNNANTNCNNAWALYCIDQQTAAAAPADPTGFSAVHTGSTAVTFAWASGGGTTAGYQIAYQTGGTAPASCTTGTVVSAATIGTNNPNTYTVTGLSSSTQYSFRLCAVNSDVSALSTGVTATVTTTGGTSSYNFGSTQFIFSTTSAYYGGQFGGIYFADYACQAEANTAGFGGVWKAIISDGSSTAVSRISLSGNVFNLRAQGSGGPQKVSDSVNFWNNIMSNAVTYTAAGTTNTNTIAWTGSTSAGAASANTCTNWTTNSSSVNGQYGTVNNTGSTFSTGATACNTSRVLYCINQQSAAAAPSNPSSFTQYALDPTAITFVWASGGGTTAAYQIAYQTGGTAPANCSAGTVVPASSIGVGATTYTLSGLSASTQYSARLCAYNSDLSASSSGLTLTFTTSAPASSTSLTPGSTQTIFATTTAYTGVFGGIYYGDFICQKEAAAAGMSGIWKSITSDESVSASSRLTIGSAIYNMRAPSAGGIQHISNGTGFWNGPWYTNANYASVGGAPGSASVWTGTSTTGGIQAGSTCTSWTTPASGVNGYRAITTTPASGIVVGNLTCNNSASLYCINQQSSSAAPADPTGFVNYSIGPTQAGLNWTSGGGTTAGYKIAYQTGGTAPADCASGTVIPSLTLGVNPSSYTVTGLAASTQYSFRLCAINSDESSASTGTTLTLTTLSVGSPVTSTNSLQQIFVTEATYTGSFGGVYFADYACQTEALAYGLAGTWKAILGDASTAANSRITLTSSIYNSRPTASGGIQLINNGTAFYQGPWTYAANYVASGGSPTTTRVWTGITNTGALNAGLTCSGWSTQASSSTAVIANNSTPASGAYSTTTACSNASTFYCINQQSASAAPPDPATFVNYALGSTTVGLSWTSGGGTTAAYQIAYQTGGTAPADCNTGTVITPSAIGVNPNSYTVTGLSAGTQYSFRLCAMNSDLSAASAGLTLTATTTASGSSYSYGSLQVIFATATTYYGNFGGVNFADFACQTEADSSGLGGVWKAVMSDESTAATSRITLSSAIFNNRPMASGGIQRINNGTGFYSGPWSSSANYNAAGGSPGSTRAWNGSTNVGATNVGLTCSSWTRNVTTQNATNAGTTTPANGTFFQNNGCNNAYTFYCINQQSSSAAPPDPSSLDSVSATSSAITLNWIGGGGTTAGYKLAYQSGGTAPASCSAGTVVSAATLGVNPSTYTVTGLSSGTNYSFRLCAVNSDQSSVSTGITLTTATTAAGSSYSLGTYQYTFATTSTYYANIGSIYVGDYICQTDANTAGLGGVWKAVMSDDSTSALSRISLSGRLYNFRPAGSGGSQYMTNDLSFWNQGTMAANANYTAVGAAPGSTVTWTGTSNAGAIVASNTCTGWTYAGSAANGGFGRSNVTVNFIGQGNTACNTNRALQCINQQTPAATPPDPASFNYYELGTSYIGLQWSSGGGTTAAYKIAYQSGGTAPADCASGTVVQPTSMQNNATTYAISGLSSNTQYSFRLCAVNSDQSSASTGLTVTASTTSSGVTFSPGTKQFIFTTASNYAANFGGLYQADFICQSEASANNMTGVWKALLSDDSTAASSRVTLSGDLYSLNPPASGGARWITNSNYSWLGVLNYALNFTSSHGNPASARTWTGTTTAGAAYAGRTCTNWTSNSGAQNGQYGANNVLTTGYFTSNQQTCNLTATLYCVNQQTAAAQPPDPATFTSPSKTSSSVTFNFSSAGGTTAAYQLSYQLGATPPANCTTGTVVPAATIGINPSAYTVTGLTSLTQYSFRLCAENSDLSAPSPGLTLTVTTN